MQRRSPAPFRPVALGALVVLSLSAAAPAPSDGTVKAEQKLGADDGGMAGLITPTVGAFGHDIQTIEDLDGDGIRELAVGGPGCDDGGNARGSIWILFLRPDGTVREAQKISQTSGGFVGSLGQGSSGDQLGNAIASLGDVDGDGIGDVAAGTHLDNGGILGSDLSCGSVWILFLKADGTVKAQQKIAENQGGYVGDLPEFGHFGIAVEGLDDLDGNGVAELAVASRLPNKVEILFLNPNGTVASQVTVGAFGNGGLAWLGDLDGDGVGELATGDPKSGGVSGPNGGTVRIVSMHADGSFKSFTTINIAQGGFTGVLSEGAQFGYSLAPAGDVNGDGQADLLVGAPYEAKSGLFRGSAWILFLTPQGTVSGQVEISSTTGGFTGFGPAETEFGIAVDGRQGDLDGDGVVDIAVGAHGAEGAGISNHGAMWMLFLNGAVTSTWTNLGQGLPGQSGLPVLSGSGTLAIGEPATLTLADAKPLSPAYLVLSHSLLAAPFKGGTLVPSPTVIFVIATDGFGGVQFSGATPPGMPPAFTNYFQFWIIDPAGPAGLAASNGLAGTTPSS